MRANEFINENDDSLSRRIALALPATYVMPDLKNQDPYLQYRFGMALASARAVMKGDVTFHDDSAFGENMLVVARSPEEEETLKLALSILGKNNSSHMISTRPSEEPKDTYLVSPIVQNSGRKITK